MIRRSLLALAEKVGARLRAGGHVGRTIAIKVRMADFKTVNRSRTMPTTTDVAREIFETSWALFTALGAGDQIRLIGVRVEGLTADARPHHGSSRWASRNAAGARLEAATDAVAARFGRSVVGPASLLGRI